MVHPLEDYASEKASSPNQKMFGKGYDKFCKQLDALKGKFPLYRLQETWIEMALKRLPEA